MMESWNDRRATHSFVILSFCWRWNIRSVSTQLRARVRRSLSYKELAFCKLSCVRWKRLTRIDVDHRSFNSEVAYWRHLPKLRVLLSSFCVWLWFFKLDGARCQSFWLRGVKIVWQQYLVIVLCTVVKVFQLLCHVFIETRRSSTFPFTFDFWWD